MYELSGKFIDVEMFFETEKEAEAQLNAWLDEDEREGNGRNYDDYYIMSVYLSWTGKDTRGICHWKHEADSIRELYDWLINKEVISTIDYDPIDKYICKRAGVDYKTVEEAVFESGNPDMNDYYVANNIDTHLSVEDYENIIKGEDGNAYYQSFEYIPYYREG